MVDVPETKSCPGMYEQSYIIDPSLYPVWGILFLPDTDKGFFVENPSYFVCFTFFTLENAILINRGKNSGTSRTAPPRSFALQLPGNTIDTLLPAYQIVCVCAFTSCVDITNTGMIKGRQGLL